MFENILLLMIAHMTACIMTEIFINLSKKIDIWEGAHRDNRALRARVRQIKEENKSLAMLSIRIAIADIYRRHNNNKEIDPKLMNELSQKEFEINKKMGLIDEWNRFKTKEGLCR